MEGLCTRMQSVGKTKLSLGSVGLWATFFPLRLYVMFDFETRHFFPVFCITVLGNAHINFDLIRRNFLSLLVLPNVYIRDAIMHHTSLWIMPLQLQYPFMLVIENPSAYG